MPNQTPQHPDITCIERNGEPPAVHADVDSGIIEYVELSEEEYAEILQRRNAEKGYTYEQI